MNILGYKNRRDLFTVYLIIFGFGIISFFVRMQRFAVYGLEFQILLTAVAILFVSAIWETLRAVDRRLSVRLPFEKNLSLRVVVQIVIGMAVGVMARFLIYLFGEPYIPFKLDSLFVATTWVLYPLFTVGVNLGFFTHHFIIRWKDEIVKAERLEREKAQVQFDNLKNQLNPHFLFNALTSLNSLIFSDQRLASDFLQQLSKVYRYVLQNKDKNFVPLETELTFIRHYVSLLETRFHGAVKISFDVVNDNNRAVVPVTLQILIENALKHNIADKDRPLTIDILTVGDYLVVGNNLQPRKLVENSNKMGLENLKSLYGFLTERPVLVDQTEDRFYVKVPLL
jgi:uncharacterized membrane-anchored protein YhcB (DUF1043 family)